MKSLLSYRKIKEIDRIGPDIVHFTIPSPQTSFFMHFYQLEKKYPTVCTMHMVFKSIFDALFNNFNASVGLIDSANEVTNRILKMGSIVVHTEDNKNDLIAKGVPPEVIEIIPHGSYALFKDDVNHRDEETEEDCILFFGYILNNKGVDYLLKAAPLVHQTHPDVKFIIAGEGDISGYRDLIQDPLKFEIYNEYIPNEMVSKLFSRAKIVVLPYTQHQGHSGVVTIAFSFGKPVIVTSVGDFPNMIQNEKEGLIVPPRDERALANAIVTLLDDQDLAGTISRNVLAKSSEFSWDKIAKLHMEVYERCIQKRNSNVKEFDRQWPLLTGK